MRGSMRKPARQLFFLIPVLAVAVSCSPQQRMIRLVERHPELVKDSVVGLSVRIPVPALSLDTSLRYQKEARIPVETGAFTGFVRVRDSVVDLELKTRPDTVSFDTGFTFPVIEVEKKVKEKVVKRGSGGLWVVLLLFFLMFFLIVMRR